MLKWLGRLVMEQSLEAQSICNKLNPVSEPLGGGGGVVKEKYYWMQKLKLNGLVGTGFESQDWPNG